MRDTRRLRAAVVVVIAAALGALVGDVYLKPFLEKQFGVKT